VPSAKDRVVGGALSVQGGSAKGMAGRRENRKHAPDGALRSLIYHRLAGAAYHVASAPMIQNAALISALRQLRFTA
jgi:hypothetical protein